METVLIAGGTGLVGKALTRQLLSAGYRVIVLTRNPGKFNNGENLKYASWNIEKQYIDEKAWQDADHVINLAGAGVMEKRWTEKFKKEILSSRVEGNKLLVKYLKEKKNTVQTILSSSAIGWYGPDRVRGHHFKETEPANDDFLGMTCKSWEESLNEANGIARVCFLRTGIVLSEEGGFLGQLKLPLKMGIAPIPGNGQQIISWIHITDLCRMFEYALQNPLAGSFNAVAPYPCSLKEITLKYAQHKRGKYFIPLHAPALFLKLALGERSIEILKSTTVSADAIRSKGFQFLYPGIDSAINII